MLTSVLPTAAAGFATGGSLILAIGAQNAYVLRQGLRREFIGVVIAICAISDAILVSVGVAGIGVISALHPAALTGLRYAGALYLAWFGLRSLLSARRSSGLHAGEAVAAGSVIATTLALTWLNPHVYLDTVVLLGSVATAYARPWLFAVGAAIGSVVWFTTLGFGARALAPVFAKPGAWRVFDLAVAAIMTALAVKLVLGLLS